MAALSPTSLLLALCLALRFSSYILAQPGYVSIDCGGRYSQPSYDSRGIAWVSDSGFIRSGEAGKVSAPARDSNGDFVFTTMRYFPDNRTKHCYVVGDLAVGMFYLVRASFWGGESPLYATQVPNRLSFKLFIDADEWADISVDFPQAEPLRTELYLRLSGSTVAVCVGRTEYGTDVPFISSIELRPLPETISLEAKKSPAGEPILAVHKEYRIHYGAQSDSPVRYPDDQYDRIWDANQTKPSLHTSSIVTITPLLAIDLPPLPVMQTAYVGDAGGFDLTLPLPHTTHFYFGDLYLAEIDPRVNASGERVFTLQGSGIPFTFSVDLHDVLTTSYVAVELIAYEPYSMSGNLNISFRPSKKSMYPPCVSAMEIFRLFDNPISNGTAYEDILAVDGIKAALVALSDWTGDPCLPYGYGYSWLNCSLSTPPEITVLSLSNYDLVGHIPLSISNLAGLQEISLAGNKLMGTIPDLSALKKLQKLNLSNNNLWGTIPNSLSTLPRLRSLSLQNNNFSGQIPAALLQKMHDGALQIEYAGNSLLCNPRESNCSGRASTREIFLIAGLVLAALVIITISVGTYTNRIKQKNHPKKQNSLVEHEELVEASKMVQTFTYRDIEIATHYFGKKLGEGGFGPVYEGQISSGQIVAVKILSETSRQGVREFVNEVGLLSRVHHRNLVGLLGYCIEQKLVLVYEYMPKGTLSGALYGDGKVDLQWRTRLGIALDAAQGLEYLHRGCSPQIIHRDVKSSNILLNDRLEAKISDFGISRFRHDDSNLPFSTVVMGTNGYHDPEYRSPEDLSEKVDVYSFGIVLMEIICGRPPIDRHDSQTKSPYIVDLVQICIEQGRIEQAVDKTLGHEYNLSSISKVTEIAICCVSKSSNRPSMSEVCVGLKEALRIDHGSVNADAFNYESPSIPGYTGETFSDSVNSPGATEESLCSLRFHGR